jgi:predicted nucleic acid-binding protein
MLVDSNILIYASQPEHAQLRRFIADHAPAVSAVSYVEVLGYPQLDDEERQHLEEFFRLARVLPLSQAVLDQAVVLRQQRKMSLGDALIAGTALVHGLTLVTRNVDDFQWVQGLTLLNPFEKPQQAQEQQSEGEGI